MEDKRNGRGAEGAGSSDPQKPNPFASLTHSLIDHSCNASEATHGHHFTTHTNSMLDGLIIIIL